MRTTVTWVTLSLLVIGGRAARAEPSFGDAKAIPGVRSDYVNLETRGCTAGGRFVGFGNTPPPAAIFPFGGEGDPLFWASASSEPALLSMSLSATETLSDAGAFGINARGSIVGYGFTAAGEQRALIWSSTDPQSLVTALPGGTGEGAYDINDRGEIVGNFTYWAKATATPRPLDRGAHPYAHAQGINNLGQIVGYDGGGMQALFWPSPGAQPRELPMNPDYPGAWTGAAHINDRGQIVGYAQLPTGRWLALYWPSPTTPFQVLSGGAFAGGDYFAGNITDSGTICGGAFDGAGQETAIYWPGRDRE